MEKIFYSGSHSLLRTLIVGVCAYVVMILFLRISGKRTLSKMNAFDFIVTIALGSTLASTLLTKDVALADGALAFAVLITLQFIISWSSVHFSWFRQWVTGKPEMLFHRGNFLPRAMYRTRITQSEIRAAVREAGMASLSHVEAVVLETDGELSVIRRQTDSDFSSLTDVKVDPQYERNQN